MSRAIAPPRPLPEEARKLCERLAAPPRLIAHLQLVHDAAADLVASLRSRFPALNFDGQAVLFGAATHDLGKVLHPGELTGPGHLHEADGPPLLESLGVEPRLARFASTHGAWESTEGIGVEDLLVALADSVWKGIRREALESRLATVAADRCGLDAWEAYGAIDEVVERIAAGSEGRLAWQASFRGE